MTRFVLSLPAIALGWVVLAACSSASLPAELPDCKGDDASCSLASPGGGGGTTDGGTSGSCAVSIGGSQCDVCASNNCCAQLTTCTNSTACSNLYSCELDCGGVSSCVQGCEDQSPTGVPDLNLLTSCIDTKCVVCTQFGVGDPCGGVDEPCNAGLTCSGLWCTKGCARSTDCVGLGANGGNALSLPNECIVSAPAGEVCVPGCLTDTDCEEFPGTFCYATTSIEGATVHVCSPTPYDAGVATED